MAQDMSPQRLFRPRCPHCGQLLKPISLEHLGKTGKCPMCGKPFRLSLRVEKKQAPSEQKSGQGTKPSAQAAAPKDSAGIESKQKVKPAQSKTASPKGEKIADKDLPGAGRQAKPVASPKEKPAKQPQSKAGPKVETGPKGKPEKKPQEKIEKKPEKKTPDAAKEPALKKPEPSTNKDQAKPEDDLNLLPDPSEFLESLDQMPGMVPGPESSSDQAGDAASKAPAKTPDESASPQETQEFSVEDFLAETGELPQVGPSAESKDKAAAPAPAEPAPLAKAKKEESPDASPKAQKSDGEVQPPAGESPAPAPEKDMAQKDAEKQEPTKPPVAPEVMEEQIDDFLAEVADQLEDEPEPETESEARPAEPPLKEPSPVPDLEVEDNPPGQEPGPEHDVWEDHILEQSSDILDEALFEDGPMPLYSTSTADFEKTAFLERFPPELDRAVLKLSPLKGKELRMPEVSRACPHCRKRSSYESSCPKCGKPLTGGGLDLPAFLLDQAKALTKAMIDNSDAVKAPLYHVRQKQEDGKEKDIITEQAWATVMGKQLQTFASRMGEDQDQPLQGYAQARAILTQIIPIMHLLPEALAPGGWDHFDRIVEIAEFVLGDPYRAQVILPLAMENLNCALTLHQLWKNPQGDFPEEFVRDKKCQGLYLDAPGLILGLAASLKQAVDAPLECRRLGILQQELGGMLGSRPFMLLYTAAFPETQGKILARVALLRAGGIMLNGFMRKLGADLGPLTKAANRPVTEPLLNELRPSIEKEQEEAPEETSAAPSPDSPHPALDSFRKDLDHEAYHLAPDISEEFRARAGQIFLSLTPGETILAFMDITTDRTGTAGLLVSDARLYVKDLMQPAKTFEHSSVKNLFLLKQDNNSNILLNGTVVLRAVTGALKGVESFLRLAEELCGRTPETPEADEEPPLALTLDDEESEETAAEEAPETEPDAEPYAGPDAESETKPDAGPNAGPDTKAKKFEEQEAAPEKDAKPEEKAEPDKEKSPETKKPDEPKKPPSPNKDAVLPTLLQDDPPDPDKSKPLWLRRGIRSPLIFKEVYPALYRVLEPFHSKPSPALHLAPTIPDAALDQALETYAQAVKKKEFPLLLALASKAPESGQLFLLTDKALYLAGASTRRIPLRDLEDVDLSIGPEGRLLVGDNSLPLPNDLDRGESLAILNIIDMAVEELNVGGESWTG